MKDKSLHGKMQDSTCSDGGFTVQDADKLFAEHKKQLDSFMKEKGFQTYGEYAYVRRNAIDVLEYLDLQKDVHGSRSFTVNYALLPLYVPHKFISFDLGGRFGVLLSGNDMWWDYSDSKVALSSFQNVMNALDDVLIPWFAAKSNKESLESMLTTEKNNRERHGGSLSKNQQAWLDSINSDDNFSEIINENIRVLELPDLL